MMFERAKYKKVAKKIIFKDYWNYFIAMLICTLLASSSNFNIKYTSNDLTNISNKIKDINIKFIGIDISDFIYKLYFSTGVILIILIFIFVLILGIYVLSVIDFGKINFTLEAREDNYQLSSIFAGFNKDIYFNIVKVEFMYHLQIFLYTLLFLFPGIIRSYQLYFVQYILADNPSISYDKAIDKSVMMTKGIKLELFVLDLSFVIWQLLNLISFGIFKYFLNPYIFATRAEAYNAIKAKTNLEFFE